MSEEEVDPIKLGNEARWMELIKLGSIGWNTWVESEISHPEWSASCKGKSIEFVDIDFEDLDLEKFVFPYPVLFQNCRFHSEVCFIESVFHTEVKFQNVTFNSMVNMSHIKCGGTIGIIYTSFMDTFYMQNAAIKGVIAFTDCDFHDLATFSNSSFEFDAYFWNSTFHKNTLFSNCEFQQNILLNKSNFNGRVFFDTATFSNGAGFSETDFVDRVSFDHAIFQSQPPDFRTTSFSTKYPPSLFETQCGYSRFPWTYHLWYIFGISLDASSSEKYRVLRNLASDNSNYEEEQQFFAHELKAKRYHLYKYWNPIHWPALVLNHFYSYFSDYGQSLGRPVFFLFLTAFLSAYGYAGLKTIDFSDRLKLILDGHDGVMAATFANLIPFAGQVVTARNVMTEELCGKTPSSECLTDLYMISAVEGLFAFLFLFLMGLAIRNKARIK